MKEIEAKIPKLRENQTKTAGNPAKTGQNQRWKGFRQGKSKEKMRKNVAGGCGGVSPPMSPIIENVLETRIWTNCIRKRSADQNILGYERKKMLLGGVGGFPPQFLQDKLLSSKGFSTREATL